jgi:hypothetical protein
VFPLNHPLSRGELPQDTIENAAVPKIFELVEDIERESTPLRGDLMSAMTG